MNIPAMKAAAKLAGHKNVLLAKKHAPTILMVGGITGMVTSTVLAAKATLEVEPIIERLDERLSMIKVLETAINNGKKVEPNYTLEQAQKDKAISYAKATGSLAKLYAPAATVGVISIAMIVGGHTIMTKRNVALAAAYTGLEKAFGKYRDRVVAEIGEDKERELRYAVEKITNTDPETGEVTETFKIDPAVSMYAQIFDEHNKNWAPQGDYNIAFMRSQQNWANDRLNAEGFLFLNDVYEMLGFPRTSAGQLVGWVKGNGDSYVDFDLFPAEDQERVREFVFQDGKELILDFNVDGVVYDLI